VGKWNRTTAGIDPRMFSDSHTGFKAALFQNSDSGAYMLAFAGTDAPGNGLIKDLEASGLQIAGMRSPQFEEAASLAVAVMRKVGSGNLTLTGHSLGGGLAIFAALSWKLNAITFNAEGLSDGTISRYGLDKSWANGHIVNYHTTLDPLTLLQHLDPFLTVPGRSVSVWNGLFSSGHSISSVCEGLGTHC